MKKIFASVVHLQDEQAIERQKKEQREVDEKEVYDINFELEFNKASLILVGMLWIFLLPFFIKVLGYDMYLANKKGELFHLSSYGIGRIVMLALVLATAVFGTVFSLICAMKSMPRVKNTNMYYRGKEYHYSEITRLVIMNGMNITKVYLNGKYKFWISSDYINYRSFIEWAKKCRIPIEGDTAIREVNNDLKVKKTRIMLITITTVIMFVLAFVIPLMTTMN